jgi:hypothetical protein
MFEATICTKEKFDQLAVFLREAGSQTTPATLFANESELRLGMNAHELLKQDLHCPVSSIVSFKPSFFSSFTYEHPKSLLEMEFRADRVASKFRMSGLKSVQLVVRDSRLAFHFRFATFALKVEVDSRLGVGLSRPFPLTEIDKKCLFMMMLDEQACSELISFNKTKMKQLFLSVKPNTL